MLYYIPYFNYSNTRFYVHSVYNTHANAVNDILLSLYKPPHSFIIQSYALSVLCNTHAASSSRVGIPRLIQRSARWVQIAWDPVDCDGGFPLSTYIVQYKRTSYYYSYTTVGEVTRLNFTVRDLSPSMSYYFRIGRTSSDSTTGYSSALSVTTLAAGMFHISLSYVFVCVPVSLCACVC